MISRRSFLGYLSAAAGATLARQAPAMAPRRQQPLFTWTNITPRVRVITGNGGNSMLIGTRDAALLVDAKSFGFGAALRREVHAAVNGLQGLILTHHHFDHAGGAAAFRPDVPIVAHVNEGARAMERARGQAAELAQHGERYVDGYLRALAGFTEVRVDGRLREELLAFARDPSLVVPEQFAPIESFQRDRRLRAGDVEVGLMHTNPGHTDNDVIVLVPAENVLMTGDLLFHGFHPFIDTSAGATTTGWERSIGWMLAQCDARTIVVPGHGEVTNRAALETQRDYFRQLREFVGTAMREGRSREEISRMPVPAFASLGWPDGLPRNLVAVYDELQRGS